MNEKKTYFRLKYSSHDHLEHLVLNKPTHQKKLRLLTHGRQLIYERNKFISERSVGWVNKNNRNAFCVRCEKVRERRKINSL